jgi:hypothetical protein
LIPTEAGSLERAVPPKRSGGSRRRPSTRVDDAPIRRSGPPRHRCTRCRQPRSTTARTAPPSRGQRRSAATGWGGQVPGRATFPLPVAARQTTPAHPEV